MFNAVAIGQDFANACEIGASGKIHSIFERAVNIEVKGPTKHLLTLICENIDIMPASLVVRVPDSIWAGLMKTHGNVILTVDNVYIDNIPRIGGISSANRWQRLLDVEIKQLVSSYKKDAFLFMCEEANDFLNKESLKSITFSSNHISNLDPLDFLGLGDGLTPSGDDFLAGMLYGVHFMERLHGESCPYLPRIVTIINKNLHRTGEISQHFLRYALEGQWGSNTENFLLALVNNNKKDLIKAINKKLNYGASSGSDELRGCLYGINEYLRNR